MVIDSHVKLEPIGAGRPVRWPQLKTMRVGQSFFAAVPKAKAHYAGRTANQWGSRHNKKFSYRLREEGGVPGIRIWRVAR